MNHIAEQMLVKYLLGEATEAEKVQVQSWMNENEDNKKEYYRYKQIWDESKHLAATGTVNEDEAWVRFKARTAKPKRRTIALPNKYIWVRAAAILVLLAGGSWLAYNYTHQDEITTTIAAHIPENPVNKTFSSKAKEYVPEVKQEPVETKTETQPQVIVSDKKADNPAIVKTASVTKQVAETANTKFLKVKYEPTMHHYSRTKEFICNATPCPLEICIIQSIKCPDGERTATSTCSILEPDESGQLRYKAFDKITRNCNEHIDEIRIKRVSTGETIVLNADSKPATAQDFFSYITGEKQGDFMAGMFHTDCNNHIDDCGLIFNNDYRSLILQ